MLADKARNLEPDATNLFKMLVRAGSVSQTQQGPTLLIGVLAKNIVGVYGHRVADKTEQGQIVVRVAVKPAAFE